MHVDISTCTPAERCLLRTIEHGTRTTLKPFWPMGPRRPPPPPPDRARPGRPPNFDRWDAAQLFVGVSSDCVDDVGGNSGVGAAETSKLSKRSARIGNFSSPNFPAVQFETRHKAEGPSRTSQRGIFPTAVFQGRRRSLRSE